MSSQRAVGTVWDGLVRSVQALSAAVADLPVALRRPTVDAVVAIVEEVGFAAGWLVRHALVPDDQRGRGDVVAGGPGSGEGPAGGAGSPVGGRFAGDGRGVAGGGSAAAAGPGRATGVRVVLVRAAVAGDGDPHGGRDVVDDRYARGGRGSPGEERVHGHGVAGDTVSARVDRPPAIDESRHAAGPGPEGISELAALATRLIEEARLRRGAVADTDRVASAGSEPAAGDGATAGSGLAVGPPSDAGGTGAGAPLAQAARGDAAAEAAVAAALAGGGAEGGRLVVGYADVVGVADPGTATRILQSRVLGALVAGDAPFLVGPGQVLFLLSDADLFEADRRFRHVTASHSTIAPVVRMGFAVPRPGDDAAALVARATGAATDRWGRRVMAQR